MLMSSSHVALSHRASVTKMNAQDTNLISGKDKRTHIVFLDYEYGDPIELLDEKKDGTHREGVISCSNL